MLQSLAIRQPALPQALWCLLHLPLFSAISAGSIVFKSIWPLACLLITTFFLSAPLAHGTPRASDVIPAPARVAFHDGVFAVRAGTPISVPRDPRAARIAN